MIRRPGHRLRCDDLRVGAFRGLGSRQPRSRSHDEGPAASGLKDIEALWVSMSAGIPTFMLGGKGDVVSILLVPNLPQRANHKLWART